MKWTILTLTLRTENYDIHDSIKITNNITNDVKKVTFSTRMLYVCSETKILNTSYVAQQRNVYNRFAKICLPSLSLSFTRPVFVSNAPQFILSTHRRAVSSTLDNTSLLKRGLCNVAQRVSDCQVSSVCVCLHLLLYYVMSALKS